MAKFLVTVCLCLLMSVVTAQQQSPVGSGETVPPNDPLVIAAGMDAVNQENILLGGQPIIKFKKVRKAQRQLTDGMKYFLDMVVEVDNYPATWYVEVMQKLQGGYEKLDGKSKGPLVLYTQSDKEQDLL